jgi:hypothetical protein
MQWQNRDVVLDISNFIALARRALADHIVTL